MKSRSPEKIAEYERLERERRRTFEAGGALNYYAKGTVKALMPGKRKRMQKRGRSLKQKI